MQTQSGGVLGITVQHKNGENVSCHRHLFYPNEKHTPFRTATHNLTLFYLVPPWSEGGVTQESWLMPWNCQVIKLGRKMQKKKKRKNIEKT